jgi:hypothetical protein
MLPQTQENDSNLTMEDYFRWVEDLAIKHRAKQALRGLMTVGSMAAPALLKGLRHSEPAVRIGCCQVLDHHMDEAALSELLENRTMRLKWSERGLCRYSHVIAARKGHVAPAKTRPFLLPRACLLKMKAVGFDKWRLEFLGQASIGVLMYGGHWNMHVITIPIPW